MVFSELGQIEEYVRYIHLGLLALCAWLVITADLTAAKSVFRPLTNKDFGNLHRKHTVLSWSLCLLWLTGAFIIWNTTKFQVSEFSPKLVAKLIVVSILTLNACIIGRLALPFMERNKDKTLGQLPFYIRERIAICGSISTASWVSAACLGAIPELKTASAEELVVLLGATYAAFLIFATVFAVATSIRQPKPIPVAP